MAETTKTDAAPGGPKARENLAHTSTPFEDPGRGFTQGTTSEGAYAGAERRKVARSTYTKEISKERREYIEANLKVQEDPPPASPKARRLEEAFVCATAASIERDVRRRLKLEQDELVALAAYEETREVDERK